MGHSGPKTKGSFPPAPQQDLGPTAWRHTGGSGQPTPRVSGLGHRPHRGRRPRANSNSQECPQRDNATWNTRNVREQNYSKKKSHRDPTRQTQNEPQYGRDVGGGGGGCPVDPMGVTRREQGSTSASEAQRFAQHRGTSGPKPHRCCARRHAGCREHPLCSRRRRARS